MRVLILGGYGVFGQRIATALSHTPGMELMIGGRNFAEAERLALTLGARDGTGRRIPFFHRYVAAQAWAAGALRRHAEAR